MVDAVEPLVISVSITPVIEPLAPSRSAPARSEIASSVPLTLSREVSKSSFPRSAKSPTGCSASG